MDFVFSAISGIFIALMIAAALTFGFVILGWILVIGGSFAVFYWAREGFRRWWFLHNHPVPRSRPKSSKVIDVDYVEINEDLTEIPQDKK